MGLLAEWKTWGERQAQVAPECPRDIFGEVTSRYLEMGPENLGDRSGLEEVVPETSEEEETSLP